MRAERILFVTGKLAEPAVRRTVATLSAKHGFAADVAVMPITVAALLTTDWIGRRLRVPEGTTRIVLPGLCRGDLTALNTDVPSERGPADIRDLPEHFGGKPAGPPADYGPHDIEILAEINHAPQKSLPELLALARHYRASGADVIDVGCDPGGNWTLAQDAVKALVDDGFRVSIDSFDPYEVRDAVAGGATLVLSVNGTNRERAVDWGVEVVAVPDTPDDLASLDRTAEFLAKHGVPFRLDPILEPIGFGFAASLGRYLDVRKRFPAAAMMMGVGNLTELTDADSAGVNVLLAGYCQELGVRSVLTTEVAPWCRSSVKEFALARRLVHYAVTHRTVPKRLEPELLLLRDPKLREHGEAGLRELAAQVTDPNYRVFAERGEIHIFNGAGYWHGGDPFAVFADVLKADPALEASHAFYLGYEFAKAVTALTLGKQYTQDRALRWGFLSIHENAHRPASG